MIQNRESVVASGNTVDVDRQDAAKSLLAIHSSPPAFTGEQNFPYFPHSFKTNLLRPY